jgi:hypothetical protein
MDRSQRKAKTPASEGSKRLTKLLTRQSGQEVAKYDRAEKGENGDIISRVELQIALSWRVWSILFPLSLR